MGLKALHETLDEIPEQFRELYTDKNGKWELTGIEGIKTSADVDRLTTSLTKERNDHKSTKEKLIAFGDLDATTALTNVDQIAELNTQLEAALAAAGDGKPDEAAIERLVEARVVTQTKPMERDLEKLRKTNAEQADIISAFELRETNRTISDAVRMAAGESKIVGSAMEDALMLAERVFEVTEDGAVLTRDNVGVTPGIDPVVWLTEMQEKRPHWWPSSQGGGAAGGGAGTPGAFTDNPFTGKNWNMTKQGQMMREDPERAARMAKSAGTTVGGPRPTS